MVESVTNTYLYNLQELFWQNCKSITLLMNSIEKDRIKMAQKYLDPDKKILEIGCGLIPTAPINKNTTFLDISKHVIAELKKMGANGIQADISKINLTHRKFDIVLAFEIIEHVKDDLKALKNISRTLKKHGIFILSTPLNQHRWDIFDSLTGHKRRYDIKDLMEKLHETKFRLVKYSLIKERLIIKLLRNLVGYTILLIAPFVQLYPNSFNYLDKLFSKIKFHKIHNVNKWGIINKWLYDKNKLIHESKSFDGVLILAQKL